MDQSIEQSLVPTPRGLEKEEPEFAPMEDDIPKDDDKAVERDDEHPSMKQPARE